MLRSVVVMTSAGVVLFDKVFTAGLRQELRMVGMLLTTMIEFSQQAAGSPVSFIQMDSVAVTIVVDSVTRISCALFTDASDGQEFGQLVTTEILRAFLEEYEITPATQQGSLQPLAFQAFGAKIPEAIRKGIRPILQSLQHYRGVVLAVLVTDEDVAISTYRFQNEFGVVANVKDLVNYAREIMTVSGGEAEMSHVTLAGDRMKLYVSHIRNAHLIVQARRNVDQKRCADVILQAAQMLRRVYALLDILQGQEANLGRKISL